MNDTGPSTQARDLGDLSLNTVLSDLKGQDRVAALRALISQAQRAIDEIPQNAKLIVQLDHPRLGMTEIGVPARSDDDLATLAETAYGDISQAIEIAARKSIDRASYDSDDDYEQAVRRRASQFEITGIARTGETHRWKVRVGSSLREPDIEVYATNESDAEFLARWTQGRIHQPVVRLDTIEGFLAEVFAIEIATVQPEPVSLLELYQTLAQALTPGNEPGTWGPTLKGGPSWEALQEHMKKLHALYGMPQTTRGHQTEVGKL